MACTEAPACRAALDEASDLWPGRSTASDGICGDPRHAGLRSDHNPNEDGYATAFDLTSDPGRGVFNDVLSEMLRQRGDPRVKYIIWDRKIWNPAISPRWRPYTGSNPHTTHMHVSIYDQYVHDVSPWWEPEEEEDDELIAVPVSRAQGGYIILQRNDGGVFTYDGAPFFGSVPQIVPGGVPVVGADWTPNGQGYWILGSDGGVFTFGNAQYLGGFNTLPPEVRGHREPVGLLARGGGYRILTFDPSGDSTPYDHYDFG